MTVSIVESQAQNQYYDEQVAEGVLPFRMMQIPSGTFLMGSSATELERTESEGPQHKVTVPQLFMAKYPVTQAQWRAVASRPQVSRELEPEPAHFKGDMRPVEKVSWLDAVEFCDRLTLATNRQYRLPTEAEWEYACRAGTTTPFHFGETLSTDYANYCGQDWEIEGTFYPGSYGIGEQGKYRQETTPIDQFNCANAYGLCDMHGNVCEWCQDHWHENYESAPTDGSAWITDDKEANRVLRGGAWNDIPWVCRSAIRLDYPPGIRYNVIGFRVSCSAPRTQ